MDLYPCSFGLPTTREPWKSISEEPNQSQSNQNQYALLSTNPLFQDNLGRANEPGAVNHRTLSCWITDNGVLDAWTIANTEY